MRIVVVIAFLLLGFSAVNAKDMKKYKIQLPESGVSLSYSDNGLDAPAVIMIHGLGSYSRAFDKMVPQLQNDLRLIIPDLPGYADSTRSGITPSMEAYAAVIGELITALELSEVTLVGHSMGGQIALTYALTEGVGQLKGLFLLAPAGIELFSEQEKDWFFTNVTATTMAYLNEEQILQNFHVNFSGGKLPEDARFMYEDRIALKNDETRYPKYLETVESCIRSMLTSPVYDRLSAIDCPVNVVFGEDDVLIPNRILHPALTQKAMLETLRSDHPAIEVQTVSGAGHFVQWDQPEEVSLKLQEFINQKP